MAIVRSFKESLQKCLRALEISRSGPGGDGPAKRERIGTEVYCDHDLLARGVINRKVIPRRRDERIFFMREALRAGFTIEEIFHLPKIDPWLLARIKESWICRRCGASRPPCELAQPIGRESPASTAARVCCLCAASGWRCIRSPICSGS